MKGKLNADSGRVNCKGVDFREIKEVEALEPADWSDGAGYLKNLHYQLISMIQTQTPAALGTYPFWEIEVAQLRSSEYVFWSKVPGFKPRLPHTFAMRPLRLAVSPVWPQFSLVKQKQEKYQLQRPILGGLN